MLIKKSEFILNYLALTAKKLEEEFKDYPEEDFEKDWITRAERTLQIHKELV